MEPSTDAVESESKFVDMFAEPTTDLDAATGRVMRLAATVSGRQAFIRGLWSYPKKLGWRDGDPIDRLLLWPEVFRQVRDLPAGTTKVYVRLRSAGPSLDTIRLAVWKASPPPGGEIRATHIWRENGATRRHEESIGARLREKRYTVNAGANVQNEAILLETR